MQLAPARACCRLCGATLGQRRVGRETRLRLGQWLVRCGACAGLYLDPDMDDASQAEFYAQHYRRLFPYEATAQPGERFILARRSREIGFRRARALAPLVPAGGRVLEVGAGDGGFLGRMHALRPDLVLEAVEPDKRHRGLALDGAPVRFHDLLPASSPHFDLIVLFHTLEHLTDPVGDLAMLRKLLAPAGRIVIEVPDGIMSWVEVHPAHVTIFTPTSLERAIRNAGLAPVTPMAAGAAMPSSVWMEAGPADQPAFAAPAPEQECAELDRRLTASLARRPRWTRRMAGRVVRIILGTNGAGALSRWRQGPALDDGLTEAEGRRFRLGIGIDPVTMDTVVERAVASIRTRRPFRVADVNVAKLMGMRDSWPFRMAVLEADLAVPDGMGVVWGARLLGLNVPERVSGVDLLERIAAACAHHGFRPFFVGARAEVLERALANLTARHPGLRIAGWQHGYFHPSEEQEIAARIRDSGADCVIAALPSPRQDLFLARIHEMTGVPYAMGVGGSLDVLAGDLKRAPVWMRHAGLEWLFRLIQEPLRLGPRYLSTNARFGGLLLVEWIARRL